MQGALFSPCYVAKFPKLFFGAVNSSARTKKGDRTPFLDLHEFLKKPQPWSIRTKQAHTGQ